MSAPPKKLSIGGGKPNRAMSIHTLSRGRFSRSGSTMMYKVIQKHGPGDESLSYAKKTQEGIPPDLLALSTRLEEVQQKKKLIFTNTVSKEERREFFVNELCDGQPSEVRLMAFELMDSAWFTNLMLSLIVLNSVTMVINALTPTYHMKYGYYCEMLEPIFLSFYVIEAVIKIYAKREHYFGNYTDLFDFVIVILAFMDMITNVLVENGIKEMMSFDQSNQEIGGSLFLGKIFKVVKITRVLKSFRSVKLLRLIKIMDKLVSIVATLFSSLQAVTNILLLIIILLVFFCVLFFLLYNEVENQHHFSTFLATTFTLIQILTLDDWFGIYTDVASNLESDYDRELLFGFMFLYLFLGYFFVLNLFIAVLVDNFHQASQTKETKEIIHRQVEIEEQRLMQKVEGGLTEISDVNLRARLVKLNSLIGEDSDHNVDEEYESSESELDAEDTKQSVLDNIRQAMGKDGKDGSENLDKRAINTNFWYYRLLATIEKQLHNTNDQLVTHDRIVSLLVDDPEEVLLV